MIKEGAWNDDKGGLGTVAVVAFIILRRRFVTLGSLQEFEETYADSR